jgi:pimeloyl-ACP methyl ester carboxylesterase
VAVELARSGREPGDSLEIRLPAPGADGVLEEIAVRFDRPPESAAREPTTILYLHGFGSSQGGEKAEFFRERAVDRGFAFCSFDFRGHGRSGGGLADLTFSRNLDDVARVRAWLASEGIEKLALVGSSMGGATALWAAARHPEGILGSAQIAPALTLLADLERWAGPDGLDRWRRDGVFRFDNDQISGALRWDILEDLRRYPLDALVAVHRGPCLIFQGRQDPTVDWRAVADFTRRAPRGSVEMILFDDGDHRLIDRKPALWERLSRFLSDLARKQQEEPRRRP